jgi:DNA helicase II / ATP-dependent DNA helicase PcrA
VCHLIQEHGVPADRILAVTFTNKAAGEMRERISRLLRSDPAGMWMGTFHAIGARLLRRHADRWGGTAHSAIFDAEQSLRLVKSVQESLGIDPKRWSPKAIRAADQRAKNQLIGAEEFVAYNQGSFDLFVRNVARVYPEYQKSLKDQNAFDFDDLLVKPVELLETTPSCSSVTASASRSCWWTSTRTPTRAVPLRRAARAEHGNLMVVGDDDQSIYRWRGADIRNILDFEQAFPGARIVRLEQNYRSTSASWRRPTRHLGERPAEGEDAPHRACGGEPVTLVETLDENDEARWIVKEIEARYGRGPAP